MNIKQYAIYAALAILVAFLSFGVGYWSHKPVTITKTETQTIEKIVEKQAFVKDNSKIDKTVTKPDGTVEHTVIQNDVSAGSTETSVTVAKKETKEQATVAVLRPNYSIAAHVIVPLSSPLTDKRQYDIVAGYRILGEAWIEGLYITHKDNIKKGDVGVGIRIGF